MIGVNELRQRRPPTKPAIEATAVDSTSALMLHRWAIMLHRWLLSLRDHWLHHSAFMTTCSRLLFRRSSELPMRLGLRVVMISDTHGCHRRLRVPEGDVLIHGGDWTRMGLEEDAADFNAWLGELPHKHKIVVNGNHEHNAAWKERAGSVLSNATLLRDSTVTLPGNGLRVHGTEFCWPMKSANPSYDAVASGSVDVLVCHSPAAGYVDGGMGCAELLRLVRRLRPRLVVSGHIHYAHATAEGHGPLRGTTFVNASNAHRGHADMGWQPVVVDI